VYKSKPETSLSTKRISFTQTTKILLIYIPLRMLSHLQNVFMHRVIIHSDWHWIQRI